MFGVVIGTLVALVALEVAVELRALRSGWDRPLIASMAGENSTHRGAGDEVVDRTKRGRLVYESHRTRPHRRIWIASSSHAADVFVRSDEAFPHVVGEALERGGIASDVWNGSSAGKRIVDNTRDVDRWARPWHPDVVLLYQMSLDVNELSTRHLRAGAGAASDTATGDQGTMDWTARLVERSSLYKLLRGRVTPWLLDARVRDDVLGEAAEAEFERRVHAFVDRALAIEARPVLCTFATSHDRRTPSPVPAESRRFVLRYNPYLSDAGWQDAIERLNAVVRRVGQQRGIAVVDVHARVGGRPELFRDFVHFNREGHRIVGELLAAYLSELRP